MLLAAPSGQAEPTATPADPADDRSGAGQTEHQEAMEVVAKVFHYISIVIAGLFFLEVSQLACLPLDVGVFCYIAPPCTQRWGGVGWGTAVAQIKECTHTRARAHARTHACMRTHAPHTTHHTNTDTQIHKHTQATHARARARTRTHARTHARTDRQTRTHRQTGTHARTHRQTDRQTQAGGQRETDRKTGR